MSPYYTGDLSGTWETSKWSTSQTEAAQASPSAWVEGTAAVFAVNSGTGTPAFTVTMNANHTIAGIFDGPLNPNPCPVTIQGAGTMTLLANYLNAFDVSSDTGNPGTVVVNNVIAGGSGAVLCAEAAGNIYLNGVNTYTGGTQLGYSGMLFDGTLYFNSAASFGTGSITISNTTAGATLYTCGLVVQGSTAVTIPNAVVSAQPTNSVGSSVNIVGNPAGVTFSGPWTLQTSKPTLIGSGGAANDLVIISGVISSPSSSATFTKFNPGILELTATNTYAGATTVNAGILQLGDGVSKNGNLAGAITITSPGTLVWANPTALTYSKVMSGTGPVTYQGPGVLTLGAANTYAGLTTISPGTVKLGIANALPSGAGKGDVELDGTLDMGAFSSGAGALSGAGTVDNSTGAATYTLTVGGNGDPGSFSGIIQNSSGSVALTKTGTGTETLSGANTYAGNTIINAGTLQLGVANAIPVGSSVTVATNAILDLNNFSPTIAALSVSGLPPSPAGQVINYSGTLTVNGNAAAALNGQNYNGYSCISASINGPSLTKSGTHAMAFRGNNSSFGPITFSGGTLSVGAAANLLPTSMALSVPTGALFQLDANNQTIGDLSGSGGVNLGGGILTVTPGDTATFSGVIQNSELAGSSTALGNGLREYSYTNIDMTGLNGVTDNAQVNVNWGPPSGPTLACNGTSTGYGASVTPSGSLTGTYTVECWACPSNTAANISMIGTRTPINTFGFDMKFDAGGNLIHGDIGTDTAWITTTADSTFAFTANTWCHVAYVVTPTGYTIYANGNQIGTGTYASTTPILYDASHPNIYIGQYGNGEYFNGRLSDVRIWNTARTATQIQTNMNQRLVGTETGLVGYWRCDDGSGTTLTATVGVNGTLAASTGWAASNPAAVTSYYHSARWLGQVLTTVAGTYTFTTTTGDGARLWVNGTPVIDGWVSQGATARSGTLTGLAANTRYDLVMECFNGAAASLSWMPPGDSVPVIIPSANLYLPGPGSLVMNGGGTQVLSGANTYSGGTTVSAGTLEASVSGALGSGNVTVAGGANLKLDASTAINSAADLIISAGSSSVNLAYTGTRNIHAISLDGGVTYAATGHYGASANNASGTFVGTGLLNVTASPTSNALTATTNSVVTSSAVYGTPVVLTSTITGSGPTRTGTVTFWDGANWLGSAALNGSGIATLSVSNLLVTSSPHSLTAVYGGDSNYATSTSSAVSVSTTPASITAIPVVANKTYDGTTTATITSCTFGGILASDTNYVHISGTYTANFSPDGSVGVNKTVNISGLSLLGSLAGNYNLTTTASSTASITNRVLTLSGLTTPAKIYDSTTNETVSGTAVLVVTNVVSGETVTLTTGTEVVAFLTKYVANNKPVVIVSGFTLNGTTAANYVLALTNLANITTFPISVSGLTVNGKPYDGTTTATLNGTAVLAPSAFAGDNVILGGTPVVNFTNANAGLRGVTVTGYVISGNDATNYALSQPIGLAATISLAATTTAIASSVNPSVVTSNVTFTLTVACATTTKPPTGTATFYTNGTPLVPTVTLVSNTPTSATAVFSTVGLPIGTTPVEAQYGGDANFTAPLNAVSTNQIVQSGSTCSLTNRILSVTANGGNSFTLNLIGTPQAQYYILAQTNVAQPMTNWLVVTGSTNTVTNVSGLWSITVTNHAPAFYRSRAMNSCQ